MATPLGSEPSYCLGRTPLSKPLSLSQWTTCLKVGWNEPASTAARLGQDFGHNVLPALIILAIIFVALRALVRR